MYQIVPSKRFSRSLKKVEHSGMFKQNVRESFNEVVNFLVAGTRLPASYDDHQLTGDQKKYRECHIKGDLLLVYERRDDKQVILLTDIGSHSYIFG